MPDWKLAHPEAFGMSEHRGEPVQLSVQPDGAHDVSAVDLEPAVEIVKGQTGDRANGRVEDAAGHGLPQGILTPLLPTRHQIESFVELGQKTRDFRGIVLEIGIHGEDNLTRCGGEPRCEPPRLPEIPAVSQPDYALIASGKILDNLPSAVGRA